jgi:uncharacterized protein YndB with AHSA1/START domain
MSRIVARFVYAHPIDRVWRAITTRERIARWLMENDFEPRVGHRFRLRAKPMPGWDGVVNCEVLALEPPTRMVWSWQGTNMKRATTVTFTLARSGAGTRTRRGTSARGTSSRGRSAALR